MTEFERIVRPVESVEAPARRIPSRTSEPVERVRLQIGRTGSGRSFSGSYSLAVTYFCEAYHNETKWIPS